LFALITKVPHRRQSMWRRDNPQGER